MKYNYIPADTHIVFNDGDPDLQPIHYEIKKTIASFENTIGYGLAPWEQKWQRFELPAKLKELQEDPSLVPSQKIEVIEQNQSYYADEIEYIKRDWDCILNGLTIFINGKQYYIPGQAYFWLQHWRIEGKPVDFRYRDLKSWLFDLMVDEDEDCIGTNYPKHRREGCTNRQECKAYLISFTVPYAHCGMQSKDKTHAQEIHEQMLMPVWREHMPFWLKPIHNGQNTDLSTIRFSTPLARNNPDFGKKALNSVIDFRDSGEKAYDGLKLRRLFNDEIGKCLSINTLVLMYDGSTKKVQDVQPGDQLMGPDSNPRNVLSTVSGIDEMFDIIPNKGEKWGCNQHHILSLKSASIMHAGKNNPKGSILNVAVKDYLKFSNLKKKHLVQYMTGVEFNNKEVFNPYIIGLWLGDGHSRGPKLTNGEPEIFDFLDNWASVNGIKLLYRKNSENSHTVGFSAKIFTSVKGGNNILLQTLHKYNLLKNKHIPNDYLINSRINRLQLLAGLLDTDGHKINCGYEITQKNKRIAEGIVFLARSLGFFATKKEKTAVLTSKNYKCLVYRVTIFGNHLHEIPCKVKRKQHTTHSLHKNRRNPLHTGIKVVSTGPGKYYGFTLDGDHLFLLGDFTVTHNTIEVDVKRRFEIQRQCLVEGSDIIGKAFNGSTVDEMDKGGGRNFKRIADQSHYHKKNEKTGRTTSWLYNFFQPASEGFDGKLPKHLRKTDASINFIDEYGFDIINPETGLPAAYDFHMGMRASYELEGDMEGLIEYTRMFPLRWKDCWRTSVRDCNFNLKVIEDRLDYYSDGNTDKQRGNFEWENNVRDTKVIWVPDDEGKFFISYQFDDPRDANSFYMDMGMRCPNNSRYFVAGGDPYKFKTSKTGKKSNGGGAVFRKHDLKIDPPEKEITKYQTNRFVCTYSNRPKDKKIYGEDMIMMCHYFGCQMNPEINVEFLWDYFEDRNYGRYLYYTIDQRTQKISKSPGSTTHEKNKEQIFREYQYYIQHYGCNERHDELLQECKDIEDDMRDYDLFVSGGYALMAVEKSKFVPETQNKIDIGELFPAIMYN